MIKSISYENKLSKWTLLPLRLDRLTLLVGASGVGKTRILWAINGIKLIASGRSLAGRKWQCEIVDDSGKCYSWAGEFERGASTADESDTDYDDYLDDLDQTAKIVSEELRCDGDVIFSRNVEGGYFKNDKLLKLPSDKSLLATLREEDAIWPVTAALNGIVLSQGSRVAATDGFIFSIYRPARLLKSLKSADDIGRSSLRVLERLYASQHRDLPTFARIKEKFREVFPEVEDLKIDQRARAEEEPVAVVSIKERGIDEWIESESISSGMLRTLLHISEIALLQDNSVLLIDEFENSLGVNCIDVVTEEVLQASSRIQCIMTSHHPYVINNVGYEHWRIVTRKGSTVTTSLPSEVGIGRSTQDKFLQLINSRPFRGV